MFLIGKGGRGVPGLVRPSLTVHEAEGNQLFVAPMRYRISVVVRGDAESAQRLTVHIVIIGLPPGIRVSEGSNRCSCGFILFDFVSASLYIKNAVHPMTEQGTGKLVHRDRGQVHESEDIEAFSRGLSVRDIEELSVNIDGSARGRSEIQWPFPLEQWIC